MKTWSYLGRNFVVHERHHVAGIDAGLCQNWNGANNGCLEPVVAGFEDVFSSQSPTLGVVDPIQLSGIGSIICRHKALVV